MSNVATKNLILSQPKSGTTEVKSKPVLASEIKNYESTTVVSIEIPGVDPSTVEVHCENNLLQVTCEKGEFVHTVGPAVDTSKIKAEIQWGLLTLTVPAPVVPPSLNIKVNIHDPIKKAPSKFTKED